MSPEQFAADWAARRRRQAILSGSAAVFLLLLVGLRSAQGAVEWASTAAAVLLIAFVPVIGTIAVMSMLNCRCPNCKRMLGSGIFFTNRCRGCGMGG